LVQICNIGLNTDMHLQRKPITDGVIDLPSYLPKVLAGGYSEKLELELFDENLNNKLVEDVIIKFSNNMKKWLN